MVRFASDPGAIAHAVREQIHLLDPSLAIFTMTTMAEHFGDALFLPRFAGSLFGVFGFLGLALASESLYGAISALGEPANARNRDNRLADCQREHWKLASSSHSPGNHASVYSLESNGLAITWPSAKILASFVYGVADHDMVTLQLRTALIASCHLSSVQGAIS